LLSAPFYGKSLANCLGLGLEGYCLGLGLGLEGYCLGLGLEGCCLGLGLEGYCLGPIPAEVAADADNSPVGPRIGLFLPEQNLLEVVV